jgi:hypothetical protein
MLQTAAIRFSGFAVFTEEYQGLTGVPFFFVDLTSGEIQQMKDNRLSGINDRGDVKIYRYSTHIVT